MVIYDSLQDLIGNTPMVRLQNMNSNERVEIYIKLEKFNPGGSVKDRIAKYMIEQAEEEGTLKKGMIVIEPTSGNTGIGLALVCRLKGYDFIAVMPENMSLERKQILIALGAKIIVTEAEKGMNAAEDYARNLVTEYPDRFFLPDQFSNKANVLAHYETTAEEIWRDTNGTITHFICGLGTTGTALGVSKRIKTHLNPKLKVITVMPSPDTPIPGLKNFPEASYTPKIWQPEYIDEIHLVRYDEAEEMARLVTLKEGLFIGPSSGAILHIAMKKAKELEKGVMVVIAPDGGERYLSTTLCTPERCLECAQRYAIRCTYFDGKPIEKASVPSVSL
ncbi:MAG: PLP-dependent cysteine synthase family protein [Promethearchaeota archaeon]